VLDPLYDWWEATLRLPRVILHDLLYTLLALSAYLLLRRFVVRPLSRRFDDVERRYTAQKTGNAVLTALLVIFLGGVWFGTYGRHVLDFAAIFAAGLAIALKEPITNFAGWIYILLRRPFDRVEVLGRVMGDVVDQRVFMFSVLEVGGWVDAEQSSGRIVHVPNGVVFSDAIANHTQGFAYVWNEIPVTVTFESDWRRAHEILTQLGMELTADLHDDVERQVQESSTQFMVHYSQFNAIVWVRVVDIGVQLTLRYLCPVRGKRVSESELWQAILEAFEKEERIEFALPIQRYWSSRSGPSSAAVPAPNSPRSSA
jgi:small-conductance mechanosensitive channel